MPLVLLVTGDRGAGKSTLCTTLAGLVSRELGPKAVRGVVTKAAANGDRYAVLYPGGEEHFLASKTVPPDSSDFGSGPQVGPFRFSAATLDIVNAHFRRVREHHESAPGRIKLWILDEIGPLELSQGSGFLPALEKLARTVSADAGEMTAVVVVRPTLIVEVEGWFQREGSRTGLAPEVEHVYLTPEDRDSLPSRLASRVYE